MNREEFIKKYHEIGSHAMAFIEKSRNDGLLALEEDLNQEKIIQRDIFEYGMRFVIDGIDKEILEKILSNIIKQERDENMQILKTIQKEAVLMIHEGLNPYIMYHMLNSYTDLRFTEDRINEDLE
jgi:flagellar motor component MotA